ncbi:FHA domain-containing protein [Cohnella sp. GCM10027633]|uniref:FHA domain-containing protein n=1 Tax=unclassified Cohnella TaxID=2636738 RepID=UPI00362751E7
MPIMLLGLIAAPAQAAAAGSMSTSTAQVTVGTLPLLAALGIGIAVAVGAVIAFLQMTAKGKAFAGQMRVSPGEDADSSQETYSDDGKGSDSTYEEDDEADDTLTDYTIPVTQILASPDTAEPAVAGEPRLCGIDGEHAGASYRLLNRRLLIGRDSVQCGVVFPYESGEVSRKHCTVRYDADKRVFLLEDHGSSNGTFLADGVRLIPGKLYELRDGERFSLSGAQHLFEVKTGE